VNRYAGVDQKLLEQEKIIRSELFQTEQELYKLESKGESTNELFAIRDRYSTVKHEYTEWMERVKKESPGYYRLRFDHQAISPQQVQQNLLKPGEALLEYFVGDSTLTVFGFTQSNKYLHQQKLPSEFIEKVDQLRTYLASNDDEKSKESFLASSAWLYDLLLRDCMSQLGTGVTSLTIVPDGILGYVPFEILTDSGNSLGHYLISDYSVHYAYSATYLNEQFQKKSSGSTSFFAGFVSAGSENLTSDEALGFLKGAQGEVASIVELLGRGSSVFNPATKKDFIQRAGEYKVLHLAMHSLVNDQNPMLSELVFSEDPSDSVKDNRLTAVELYNMQLNADMAVLSACNTGTGKAHRGEGIMSMSRAFAFAGVPSAVISLWQVPDKATSRIMVKYYHFLKEGNTKDKALQLAKQSFTKDYPQMKDPFYWSGFIVTGSNAPLEFPSPLWWMWLVAVIILTSAFVMMARKGIHKKLLAGFASNQ
jgi:CHAT domain-containing protein